MRRAWGEPVPATDADVKKLAKKGTELLEKFHEATDKKPTAKKTAAKPKTTAKVATAKTPAKKTAVKTKQS